MANIQMGTADGSTLGNPPIGDFYIFLDSNNADAYTLRDTAGADTILGGAVVTVFTPTINSVTMKEVSVEADFGTAVGGVITLTTNTTYFLLSLDDN